MSFFIKGEIDIRIGNKVYLVSYSDDGKAYDMAVYKGGKNGYITDGSIAEFPDEVVDAMLAQHHQYIHTEIAESIEAQRERYEDEQREYQYANGNY